MVMFVRFSNMLCMRVGMLFADLRTLIVGGRHHKPNMLNVEALDGRMRSDVVPGSVFKYRWYKSLKMLL